MCDKTPRHVDWNGNKHQKLSSFGETVGAEAVRDGNWTAMQAVSTCRLRVAAFVEE